MVSDFRDARGGEDLRAIDARKVCHVGHAAFHARAASRRVGDGVGAGRLRLGALRGENPGPDEYGRPRPSTALGNEVRRKFLERAGVDVAPYALRDGSGLARQNLVTPRGSARLLEFMLAHPAFPVFRDSLTVAGVDGTLKRRMRDSAATNNLRGKTGTLSAVNALSGYVATRRGQMIVFSLVGNNYAGPGRDVTAVLDAIGTLLADFEGELP